MKRPEVDDIRLLNGIGPKFRDLSEERKLTFIVLLEAILQYRSLPGKEKALFISQLQTDPSQLSTRELEQLSSIGLLQAVFKYRSLSNEEKALFISQLQTDP